MAMSKSRILFLDDRSKRFTAAMKRWKDDDLTLVATAKECIKLLTENKYNLVSLDHDLDFDTFVTSSMPNTGMEVVRYIERYYHEFFWKHWAPRPPHFIIHSSNAPARAEMVRRLREVGLNHTEGIRFEYD